MEVALLHYFSAVPFVKMAHERGYDNVWGSMTINHYLGGLNPFALGVEKIILTHPAYETTALTVEDILSLTALGGVYAEESYALMPIDNLTPADVASYIRGVGAEHTIMTTDLGQKARMSSGEGMALFASLMVAEGISPADIRNMMVDNPRKLLDL